MGENDCIDRSWIDGQWFPVLQSQLLKALEQSTIQEESATTYLYQELRPRNGSYAAKKGNVHPSSLPDR